MEYIFNFINQKTIYLPVLYICIAILVYGVCKRILTYIIQLQLKHLPQNGGNYKKVETLGILLKNIGKYIIGSITLLAILTVYGIDVGSILAGLGILGAVLGLALQDTFKDFIAGISILLENQFAIGDNIEIDGFRGEVIFLGLKTTKIKSYEGSVKILANRNIGNVINNSLSPSLALVDIAVSNREDIKKVEKILKEVADEQSKELQKLKGPVEILGINKIEDSNLVYRLSVLTEPAENFQVERDLRRAIKIHFDQANIKIAYPHMEVTHGDK